MGLLGNRLDRASAELTCSLEDDMVDVDPKRPQHALVWLVEQAGLEGVAEACAELGEARRAYPPNTANVLPFRLRQCSL